MGSGPTPAGEEAEARRLAFERNLMEADRMTMQTVQTAVSLIGFGATITAFFGDVADRLGGPTEGRVAPILGMALLFIGLLLLTMGTWTQVRYRRTLRQRYADVGRHAAAWAGLQSRLTPSFVAAVLLMGVGLFGLVAALIRWFL